MRAEFCIFESNAPGLKANFYEPYVDKPSSEPEVVCQKSLFWKLPRSQKSTDSRRWLWRCLAPFKTVAMPKNGTFMRVFISSLQRCAESGTLLVFFLEKTELEVDQVALTWTQLKPCRCSLTKKTAPMFPLRDFLTQICLKATMSSSTTTGPAILPPLTRRPPGQTRKISMEGVDNQALTEKAVQSLRVSEFGQHFFTRTTWNLIFWVLWSPSFQNIWYFLLTKVNGCRVICTYSRGSQKWPCFTKLYWPHKG